jgi:hypothetical protein
VVIGSSAEHCLILDNHLFIIDQQQNDQRAVVPGKGIPQDNDFMPRMVEEEHTVVTDIEDHSLVGAMAGSARVG